MKTPAEGRLPAITQFLVGAVTVAVFSLLFTLAISLGSLNEDRAQIVLLYKQAVHNCLAVKGCVVAPNHLVHSVACHPKFGDTDGYWMITYRDGTQDNVTQDCESAPGLAQVKPQRAP